jgi:DNA-directed RNA polymerase subunit RPC12/RpoP
MERQELWCHECEKYVQFDIDTTLNGNHIIKCPNCGHEHLRVVNDGVISETRWGSRNSVGAVNPNISSVVHTYMTTGTTSTNSSTYSTYIGSAGTNTGSMFSYMAWMNTGTGFA